MKRKSSKAILKKNWHIAIYFFLASNIYAQSRKTDSLKAADIEMVKISKILPNVHQQKINVTYSHLLSHDAGKFLSSIPEISGIRKAGNFATDPVLRGFKYEQLNIVIDGAANAINACPSRMDPAISQVNMNMVQEAEIFKGSYHFRHGSSLGGTINFVTVPPEFTDSLQLKARFSTGYESNGNIFRNELFSRITSKKIVWDIFGSYQKGDRYKGGNGDEVPSAFLRYNAGTKASLKWSDTNTTTLQINSNQGRDVEFAALKMDLLYDKTWMFQLKHLAQFRNSALKHIDFNSYLSTVRHSMGTPDRSMVSDVKSSTHGARAEAKFSWNKNLLYSGIDFKHEEAQNTGLTMTSMMMPMDKTSWQNSEINQLGWFNEWTYQLKNASFTASYRLDFNSSNAKEMSKLFETLYGTMKSEQINHSFSAGYKQILDKNSGLSFWIGRGQRSPSLTERYINRFVVGTDDYEVVGNPELKAETNNQADLIYTFRRNDFYFQADVFYSYLQNFISGVIRPDIMPNSMQSPGVRQMQNIEKAFKTGIESRINWKFLPNYKTELALAYTYAENSETKLPLSEIAPFSLKWNMEAQYSELYLGINYYFSAKQNRIASDFGEMKTPEFSVFDFYSRYSITKNILVNFEVSNIFNRTYAEHMSRTLSTDNNLRIPERGRSFNISMNILF